MSRTIRKLSDEVAVEDGLDLDLASEVQLTVRLTLLCCGNRTESDINREKG